MAPLILIVAAGVSLTVTSLPPQECVGAASAPALDHVVLVVQDLDRVAESFRRHGFRLKRGRLHANNLLNRHVKFHDGSSLELMTIAGEPGDAMAQRYVDLLADGEGGVYVALTVGSAADPERAARALGLDPRRSTSGPWRFVSFPPATPAAAIFFSAGGVAVLDPDSLISHRPDVAGLSEAWLEGGAELGALLEGLGAKRCGAGQAVDLRAIATTVARNAGIRPGELVWIRGGSGDLAFMEQLAVAVGALGGHPLVDVFSDATMRQWYEDVPAVFDTQRDEWTWLLSENADVFLEVGRRDPHIWGDLPPERLDAYDASNPGLGALLRERGVRRVWLGNGGIHPSAAYARMFGISLPELECIYWKGLATDPALLATAGSRLLEILQGASSIQVRHPNGTDITVRPGRGSILVSDGTVPPNDESGAAAAASETWLPGGEVTLGLDPESAEGRLIVDRVFFDGENIGPLSLYFSGGRLETMESDKDLSSFREHVHSAHPLSDRLTGLKFGLNPDMTDQRVLPFMGAGMFSLSMGMNSHLGGDIDMPFLVFLTLAGSTVHVDGRVVVEDGSLKL